MRIDIITCFPEMFVGPFDYSIVKRAQEKGLVTIEIHNLRKWTTDKYKSVDDKPYGGGPGMVMRVDILERAVSEIKGGRQVRTVLMDARGEKFNQKKAQQISTVSDLIIICGHYEGVDHRVHDYIASDIVSVGDYVLSGGELPAMTVVDSVLRLIPGVLGNEESLKEESHNEGEVEYPQYTRPEDYKGWKVPEILLSGDHKKIEGWRKTKH